MAGGTQEAPSWLTSPPAGKQLPTHGATFTPMQDNWGDVSVGSPAQGKYGLKGPASSFPPAQENYGGVSVGSIVSGPVIGPDGT